MFHTGIFLLWVLFCIDLYFLMQLHELDVTVTLFILIRVIPLMMVTAGGME